MRHLFISVILLMGAMVLSAGEAKPIDLDAWKQDVGKPAPALDAAAWLGGPVSLDAVRGNVVLLAFWDSSAGS